MSQFTMNDGSGFQMHYEIIEGLVPENTLFIHGNLASNRWWYPAVEAWKKNSKGKQLTGKLIFAEWRGCGKSTAPKAEEVTMARFAADYNALIEHLALGPVHVVGHSTGGLIAGLAMAQAPKNFKKAVMLDPVGPSGVKFEPAMTDAFEAMKKDKDLVATVMNGTIYNNNQQGDFFRQVVVEDAFTAVKQVGDLVLKALDGLNSKTALSTVMHPTLVLHGQHDQLLSMDESKAFAACMNNGKFMTVEGQGHCTNAENPELFVKIVDQFLFA